MRRLVLALAALLAVGVVIAVRIGTDAPASRPSLAEARSGQVRTVVAFIGDSNLVMGSGQIDEVLDTSESGYVPVDAGASGSTIRWNGCNIFSGRECVDRNYADYWKVKVAQIRKRMRPDVYVVDLGINDAFEPGAATSVGYAHYPTKIDWMMQRFPADKPVLWTNLACALEPAGAQTGCTAIDAALAAAPARWKNLTVVDWAAEANAHPEYMDREGADKVHYSTVGYHAYASLILATLATKVP
jgi:hypothetical protein